MPRIPTYERQRSITGQSVAAPVPADFGTEISDTVSKIASDYGDIIEKHNETLRKRDNANKLINIQTAIDDEYRAFAAEEESKTGPDSYDNLTRAKEFTSKATEKFTKDITDPDLALDIQRHVYSRYNSTATSLTAHQVKQRNEVTKQTLESASQSRLKDAYSGMPIDAVRERLFKDAVVMVDAGTFDNSNAESYIVEEEKKIAEAYLDGVMFRDPKAAFDLIRSGQFNKYLEQKTIEKFDKEIQPKLKAYAVDDVVTQVAYMMPENEDEPFEIDKIMKKVDTLTDDPEVRKDARAQLKSIAADRVAAGKERFEYNYGKIADAWELNPRLSTSDIMKMPEFSKLTTAQQGNALAKIRQKIEHRDTTERATRASERAAVAQERTAGAAERAAVERKYDSAYYYWRSRPEEIASMTDSQFSALRLEMGDKQFAHLQDDRKKINSPEALSDATIHTNVINGTLDRIPGIDDSMKGKYLTKLKSAIAREQKRVGHQLSKAEVEQTVIEDMQMTLVKEKGFFGGTKEKRKIEILKTDTPVIPQAYLDRINKVAAKRGKVLGPKEQYNLYQAMLKDEGKK